MVNYCFLDLFSLLILTNAIYVLLLTIFTLICFLLEAWCNFFARVELTNQDATELLATINNRAANCRKIPGKKFGTCSCFTMTGESSKDLWQHFMNADHVVNSERHSSCWEINSQLTALPWNCRWQSFKEVFPGSFILQFCLLPQNWPELQCIVCVKSAPAVRRGKLACGVRFAWLFLALLDKHQLVTTLL